MYSLSLARGISTANILWPRVVYLPYISTPPLWLLVVVVSSVLVVESGQFSILPLLVSLCNESILQSVGLWYTSHIIDYYSLCWLQWLTVLCTKISSEFHMAHSFYHMVDLKPVTRRFLFIQTASFDAWFRIGSIYLFQPCFHDLT